MLILFFPFTRLQERCKNKREQLWPLFDRDLIEYEVVAAKHWKLSDNDVTVCICCVSLSDPNIGEELEKGDAVYLHRIVTHPEFNGNRYIDRIVEWSRRYVLEIGRKFIRLDTVASNQGLRKHYLSAGFTLVRTVNVPLRS